MATNYDETKKLEAELKYGDCWKTKDPLPFWAYLMLRYNKSSVPCSANVFKWGFWTKEGFVEYESPVGERRYLEKANLKYNKNEGE